MIRLLGATLLAAGCAWIGFRASWEMRARGRAMGEVAEGLELLERELELGGAPLPHLVDDLSGRTRGQARLLFQDLRQALEHLDQEGLSRSWPTLIDRRRELGESGRACLYPLGSCLGAMTARPRYRVSPLPAAIWRKNGRRMRKRAGGRAGCVRPLG